MKTQIITLKITVSDDYNDPENWDWSAILDLGDGEDVEMLDYQNVEQASSTVTDKLREFFESQDPAKLVEALRCS